MVHHGVNRVVESILLVQNEDRLHGSIPSVLIKILKLEKTNVSGLADVSLLVWLVLAVGVGASNSFIVWHDCEILGCY